MSKGRFNHKKNACILQLAAQRKPYVFYHASICLSRLYAGAPEFLKLHNLLHSTSEAIFFDHNLKNNMKISILGLQKILNFNNKNPILNTNT